MTTIPGYLEVDHNRGVIYFHDTEGRTRLRICSLPTPVPGGLLIQDFLDITHMHGTNWSVAK